MAKQQKLSGDYVRGSIDLVILSVLADEPKYGYLIQQKIAEATSSSVQLQAGTLYPLLHRMESEGLLASRQDKSTGRPRKWYRLTATGRRKLKQQAIEWQEYANCLRDLLQPILANRKLASH